MKKIITSAGLVVLGAASVQAAYAPDLPAAQTTKPWSVAATLRGFYDDNYTTSPRARKRHSYGIDFSPSVAVNVPLEQTYLGASYVYGLRWFEDRRQNSADHSHQANAKLSHAFTEHYKIDVSDSFVVAQEPQILDPNAVITFPLRSNGNNIRNTGQATFTADLTDQFSTLFGYSNTLYSYDQRGPGSRSALLDRMEHLVTTNLRWTVLPTTLGILGYQYGNVDYTSKSSVNPFIFVNPEIRDNDSHYAYVGVDHSFNPQLSSSIRVGAQYTEYRNHNRFGAVGIPRDTTGPYADANFTYTYSEGSYAQLGVRHARNQTDVTFLGGELTPTVDAESTTVYGSVNHRIWGGLVGSLLGQYQNSEFKGGSANNKEDNYFLGGVNLAYEINKFLAAETGYNYDRLDSDLPVRSYTRNRVYVGFRASY